MKNVKETPVEQAEVPTSDRCKICNKEWGLRVSSADEVVPSLGPIDTQRNMIVPMISRERVKAQLQSQTL